MTLDDFTAALARALNAAADDLGSRSPATALRAAATSLAGGSRRTTQSIGQAAMEDMFRDEDEPRCEACGFTGAHLCSGKRWRPTVETDAISTTTKGEGKWKRAELAPTRITNYAGIAGVIQAACQLTIELERSDRGEAPNINPALDMVRRAVAAMPIDALAWLRQVDDSKELLAEARTRRDELAEQLDIANKHLDLANRERKSFAAAIMRLDPTFDFQLVQSTAERLAGTPSPVPQSSFHQQALQVALKDLLDVAARLRGMGKTGFATRIETAGSTITQVLKV